MWFPSWKGYFKQGQIFLTLLCPELLQGEQVIADPIQTDGCVGSGDEELNLRLEVPGADSQLEDQVKCPVHLKQSHCCQNHDSAPLELQTFALLGSSV